MFDDGQTNKNWTAFVAEILGKATAWSPLAFSLSGRFKGLEKRSTVTSYALIPDRIRPSLDSSVTPVVMEGVSGSGVEAVVRVDLSHWVDPNYLAILDESKPKPSDSESVLPPKTPEVKTESSPEVKTESSPVAKPEPPAGPKGGRVTF
jgi:hypothetical protein